MPVQRSRILTAMAAAALVVGTADLAAYAANGAPLLAGARNTATKTTTLKTAKKTPLKLVGAKDKPVLKVSNSQKVSKLNADQLDGLDSTAMQTRPYVVTLAGTSATHTIVFPLSGVPVGDYLVTYNVTAAVSGGPSYFYCNLRRAGAPLVPFLPQVGSTTTGTQWYVSSSGVYSVVGADELSCFAPGPGDVTVPGSGGTAQLTLTRIDGSTSLGSTGAKG